MTLDMHLYKCNICNKEREAYAEMHATCPFCRNSGLTPGVPLTGSEDEWETDDWTLLQLFTNVSKDKLRSQVEEMLWISRAYDSGAVDSAAEFAAVAVDDILGGIDSIVNIDEKGIMEAIVTCDDIQCNVVGAPSPPVVDDNDCSVVFSADRRAIAVQKYQEKRFRRRGRRIPRRRGQAPSKKRKSPAKVDENACLVKKKRKRGAEVS